MASHGEDAREDLLLGGGGGTGVSPSSRPVIRGAAPTELYQELVELYDEDAEDLRAAVDLACSGLVAASKVPEISGVDVNDEEIGGAGIVGGSPVTSADEDERELQASVKRKFVEAMEQLQSTHVPKKRRGNLPKEATDAFRDWFNEHYEHPYPTDEEKKQLALQTNTHVAQITNWFINYRKRIWKPAGGGGVADRNSQRLSDIARVVGNPPDHVFEPKRPRQPRDDGR